MKTTTQPPPAETPPPAHHTPPPSASDAPDEPLALKAHHRPPFVEARDTILAQYGVTPTPDELMRMLLTSVPPWQIVRIFEETVLSITGSDLAGTDDEQFVLCL
jgi:hypothetical protein